ERNGRSRRPRAVRPRARAGTTERRHEFARHRGSGGALMRRSRRSARGTALIEVTIVLTFLAIVFAGVVYLGRRELALQQALLTARSCAWRYAHGACKELPPGCPEEMFQRGVADEPDPVILERVERARAAAHAGLGSGGQQGAFAAAVRDKVDRLLGF